jgi:small-conductance mechanosensitive channel
MQILKAAVDSQMGVLKQPDPFIRFTDFGDSSLNFSIIFGRKNCFALKISRAK